MLLRLKYFRHILGLTQQQLEERSGVKRYRISMAEKGELKLSEFELHKLAKLFHTDPKTILEPVHELDRRKKAEEEKKKDTPIIGMPIT